MKISASVLYSFRMLFPRTGKKSNARRSLIGAFLCIAISLIPLVMILTVSNGMVKGMTLRMIGLSSSHLCAFIHPDIEESSSYEAFVNCAQSFLNTEGILNVYPEINSVALASSKNSRTGANIRAVDNDIFSKNKSFSSLFEVIESTENLISAKEIVLHEGKNAVIGKKLSEILNIHAGDEIRLITARKSLKNKLIPKVTSFKVSAVVSSGYQELDALWVFIPLKTGYSILPLATSQLIVGMEVEDPFSYHLDLTLSKLEKSVPEFTRIYKWNELNTSQYENFTSTQIMLLFIMLLIVLVASVNISSALVMLVMERRREIAILKSLGATSSGISISFLITGLITGALGVFVGFPLGLLCSVNFDFILTQIENFVSFVQKFIYMLCVGNSAAPEHFHLLDPAFYLQKIPLEIPVNQLIIIGCGTLVLSLFASVIPAIKAGKEKPIETLRKL